MIIHEVQQGSPEWDRVRLGIPTASEFDSIITPDGAMAGKQARSFALRLIAEIMRDTPTFRGTTSWMERGQDLEEEAVRMYEFTTGNQTERIGFITNDDRTAGCSPDRLVGNDGLLEIKCPADWTHVGYLIEHKLDKQYKPQVQAQMLITGRQWVDWYSYHPDLPPLIIRVERDEEYLARMRKALKRFTDLMQTWMEKLEARGYLTAPDHSLDFYDFAETA